MPNVWLIGDVEHADFAEAASLLRATADVGSGLPELIVVAQSRPGAVGLRVFERLRRSAPLAGIVSLVGSWCEGETRTGRPAAGVPRLYWHEFANWWRRQLALRAAGLCPDWARGDCGLRIADGGWGKISGRVLIDCGGWETAQALADVVRLAGREGVWWREGGEIRGAAAGIWVGGQLNDAEEDRLAEFCQRLERVDAPVVALLDFPRRDRCAAARRAGAAAVLGKPWLNVDLAATLQALIEPGSCGASSPLGDCAA